MANPRAQKVDRARQAREDSAASNSVSELQAAVGLAIDELIVLKAEVREIREQRAASTSTARAVLDS